MYHGDISTAVELNATAKVLLGFIAARPRSGYEIKQLVDLSTRYFWAASYGRIYPELKRLEGEGLIAGADASQGARSRTVYKLTAKGRKVAEEWIASPPEVYELRDEGLLKLFFAAAGPEAAIEILDAKQRLHEQKLAALRAVEPGALAAAAEGDPFPNLVRRYGVETSEWTIEWCERARAELERAASEAKGGS
jgi:PadR family transcriptional regulator AphA